MMTVSNILNGKHNHASPENRRKIEAAAARLKYRPNLVARQLATRRNNIIGVIIDRTSPYFYHEVVSHLESLAFRQGNRLQVGMVHDSLDAIRQYVDDFAGSGVERVICLAHNYGEFGAEVPALFSLFPHVVFHEEPLATTEFPAVATDHFDNYYRAVSELLRRGRRRVVCCRAPYHDRAFYSAQSGIQAAYAHAGVAYEDAFWMDVPSWGDGGKEVYTLEQARELLDGALPRVPDTLIVRNDQALVCILRALEERGLRVPEDVALFSAELGPMASSLRPSLSGFDYNAERLAERLCARLTGAAEAGDAPARALELIPSRIVWGGSCPPPAPS